MDVEITPERIAEHYGLPRDGMEAFVEHSRSVIESRLQKAFWEIIEDELKKWRHVECFCGPGGRGCYRVGARGRK